MPRSVGDGLGREMVALPLKLGKPVLQGGSFHVVEEERN